MKKRIQIRPGKIVYVSEATLARASAAAASISLDFRLAPMPETAAVVLAGRKQVGKPAAKKAVPAAKAAAPGPKPGKRIASKRMAAVIG